MAIPSVNNRHGTGKGWTKYEKDEVRYRKQDACKTCVNYKSFGSRCEVVNGKVKPEGLCDAYSPRTQEPSPHADFYRREYEKLQGKS